MVLKKKPIFQIPQDSHKKEQNIYFIFAKIKKKFHPHLKFLSQNIQI